MIDWTKPLELMDGTPVVLVGGSPDDDGDYWISREDGKNIPTSGCPGGYRTLCVHPDGTEWFGSCDVVIVRNRRAEPKPLASVNTMAKVEGWSTTFTKTLRDEFAMAALTGLCSATDTTGTWTALSDNTVRQAYKIADAMLVARDQ